MVHCFSEVTRLVEQSWSLFAMHFIFTSISNTKVVATEFGITTDYYITVFILECLNILMDFLIDRLHT